MLVLESYIHVIIEVKDRFKTVVVILWKRVGL